VNPAQNIVLIGPTGAGKSAIGRRLAARLGLAFIDLDQRIEADSGARVALIFELEGEAGFRRRERAALAEACAGRGRLIATGAGVVLDPDNRGCIARAGFVVHLHTSVEQQLRRLERDRSRPLLRAPDRRERLQAMAEQRGPYYRELADLTFCSDGLSVTVATERLAALLDQHWQPEEVN
jgi:shikimate kinase